MTQRIANILKVLANPVRLKILALCLVKERSSKELREILKISKPLLIAHLKKLLKYGLLEYRVEFDKQRMIIRKLYRTKKNLKICIDEELLRLIMNEITS